MYYEIDFQQKGQWILWKLANEEYPFNMTETLELSNLNEHLFEQSLQVLVEWHESLRTSFCYYGGQLMHKIWDPTGINVKKIIQYFCVIENYNDDDLSHFIWQQTQVEFNLEEAPLFRVKIFKTNTKTIVTFIMSHVISDPESFEIVFRDMQSIYLVLEEGGLPKIHSGRKQLKDFYQWKTTILSGDYGAKSKNFLMSRLSGITPKPRQVDKHEMLSATSILHNQPSDADLKLLVNYVLPISTIYKKRTREIRFNLDEEIVHRLYSLIKSLHLTPFTFVASVIALLIYWINDSRNMIMSFPTTHRVNQNFKNVIGWLVSGVYINTSIDETFTFKQYTTAQQLNIHDSIEHSLFPIDLLMAAEDNVSVSSFPKFFLNVIHSSREKNGAGFSGFECKTFDHVGVFEIICRVTLSPDNIQCIWSYKEPYNDEQMISYSNTLIHLLRIVLGNPHAKISEILDEISK